MGKSRGNNSFKVLYEMMCIKRDNASNKKESEAKYSWWLNELNTLGLAVKKANDLNDIIEVSSLAEILDFIFDKQIAIGYSYTS